MTPVNPLSPERPALVRPHQGRIIGGVCAGLGAHLRLQPAVVRIVLGAGTLVAGAGAIFYVWLWLTLPATRAGQEHHSPAFARLAPRLREVQSDGRIRDLAVAAGLMALAAAVLLIHGWSDPPPWLLPVALVGIGAAIAWHELAASRRRGAGRARVVAAVAGGIALAVTGSVVLLAQGRQIGEILTAIVGGLVIVLGVAIVLAPILLRLLSELGEERAARAREAERADMAAHLHDSVLQTLAIIRSRSHDDDVARLARSQERELRAWLYADRPQPGTSVADALRTMAGEVEDVHGVPVDVVTAGDAVPDAAAEVLASAAREALSNAVRHGLPPVSLYVETSPEAVEVFVRDRGAGFELEEVPQDRYGVRESIIGRMERHGGSAWVRSRETGTEVHLRMPRQPARRPNPETGAHIGPERG